MKIWCNNTAQKGRKVQDTYRVAIGNILNLLKLLKRYDRNDFLHVLNVKEILISECVQIVMTVSWWQNLQKNMSPVASETRVVALKNGQKPKIPSRSGVETSAKNPTLEQENRSGVAMCC
jgi:hypothetical protein